MVVGMVALHLLLDLTNLNAVVVAVVAVVLLVAVQQVEIRN
jgi:hypothetical protein